jgi:heme-degrading monooxygenase HmoA
MTMCVHAAVGHDPEYLAAPLPAPEEGAAPGAPGGEEHTPARTADARTADYAQSALAPLFVALSRFTVANGLIAHVHDAFRRRPHLVDTVPGFMRLEVLSPLDNPDEVWLLTYWQDEESYRAWHRSHAYHAAHTGIPKGLKLVPHSAQVRYLTQVCS